MLAAIEIAKRTNTNNKITHVTYLVCLIAISVRNDVPSFMHDFPPQHSEHQSYFKLPPSGYNVVFIGSAHYIHSEI